MTNPFATAPAPQAPAQPQQQPTISDAAAQQFGAPAQQPMQLQEAFPGQMMNGQPQQQFAAAPTAGDPYGAVNQQQVQQPPAAPNGFMNTTGAQGLPGQPWTPQQHQQNVPQAYAPAAAVQQLPQAPFPPAVQQQASPQFAAPQMPAQSYAQQQTAPAQGFDPSMWGAPSAGGGGTYPKVRDIEGRLVLIRVKRRDAEGTAYGEPTKKITNYIANVAILDGGPVYASPNAENVMAQPELVSETVPYVVSDMIISQVGLHNRLKNDFVRGRIARQAKGELAKQLMERLPGVPEAHVLLVALQQGLLQPSQLTSGTFFWTILEDTSEQANQLVNAFAQHPSARDLML